MSVVVSNTSAHPIPVSIAGGGLTGEVEVINDSAHPIPVGGSLTTTTTVTNDSAHPIPVAGSVTSTATVVNTITSPVPVYGTIQLGNGMSVPYSSCLPVLSVDSCGVGSATRLYRNLSGDTKTKTSTLMTFAGSTSVQTRSILLRANAVASHYALSCSLSSPTIVATGFGSMNIYAAIVSVIAGSGTPTTFPGFTLTNTAAAYGYVAFSTGDLGLSTGTVTTPVVLSFVNTSPVSSSYDGVETIGFTSSLVDYHLVLQWQSTAASGSVIAVCRAEVERS